MSEETKKTAGREKLELESLDSLMSRPVEGIRSTPTEGRTIDQLEPEEDDEDEDQLVSTRLLRNILGNWQ